MRSRLARWLVRASVFLVAAAALLFAAGWAVMQTAPFGASMGGARLQRAQANPQYRDGRFVNVEPEALASSTALVDYTVRQFSGNEVREPPAPVPVLPVTRAALAASPAASSLRAFWIGHASAYAEIDGLRMLLDPVFAQRVSPLPVGPQRFHPPPVALADLPRIDAVLISHDHYDHLDMDAVRHLAAGGARFFVPLGIGAHLERWGVPAAQVQEMEWWQEHVLGGVRIVCTPSRHYSGRGLDRSNTLWSSWSVLGPRHRFFYSGDTGYSRLFQEVGTRLGPFDLAFIKIGAYGPVRRGSTSTCRRSRPCRYIATCGRAACSRCTGRLSTSRTTTGTSRSAARWPKRLAPASIWSRRDWASGWTRTSRSRRRAGGKGCADG